MKHRLVPYDQIEPGFESIRVEDDEDTPASTIASDHSGSLMRKWSTWNGRDDPAQWDDEIRLINGLQARLGSLDEDVRRIRAHIASLTPCDASLPMAVDELLDATGRGRLREPSFRNGCWNCGMWWKTKGTQPRQLESMRAIHDVVTGRLAGKPEDETILKYPYAAGFVRRTYKWLGPSTELTDLQKLLVERMLLPFEFLTVESCTTPFSEWDSSVRELSESVMKNCFAEGGRGAEIDTEIATQVGLPKITMRFPDQARQAPIGDPQKMDLYILCCALAHGLHTLSDCHHSTFRWIESWIYSIGTGRWGIPTRRLGSERQRVGRLLFGYLLGIDRWLMGIPMQFLLLDFGHVGLGLDPKNEIVRVYAYLGTRKTQVKEWLVACLWHSLMYSAGGLAWRNNHLGLIEHAGSLGIGVRDWMDSQLGV